MLSERTTRKLGAIAEVSAKEQRIKDLSSLMNHPDLWMLAYTNIQGNTGALTPGTDNVTIDGFTPERAQNLIDLIREKRYWPKPVRRAYIPKGNSGKLRPLGLPSGDDKLVQEVARILLERIYEPIFKNSSHGFRPKKSCHTALQAIKNSWTGIKWIVEVDIKGFFDNINHDVLMMLLERRIDDRRFLRLWIALQSTRGHYFRG